MERRDIIEDEIKKVSTILRSILARYYDLAPQEEASVKVEVTNRSLKTDLGIDIEAVMSYSSDELKSYTKQLNLTGEQLDMLSEYLASVGDTKSEDDEGRNAWYEKAIDLLEIADEGARTLSFARFERRNRLRALLLGYT